MYTYKRYAYFKKSVLEREYGDGLSGKSILS